MLLSSTSDRPISVAPAAASTTSYAWDVALDKGVKLKGNVCMMQTIFEDLELMFKCSL